MAQEPRVFDSVALRQDDRWSEVTIETFLALPLSTRIRHVLEKSVAFRLGKTEVDPRVALAAVRKARIA